MSISSTFYVQFFCTNVVSAAFSTYMLLDKSCQNNLRKLNVDEIDYSLWKYTEVFFFVEIVRKSLDNDFPVFWSKKKKVFCLLFLKELALSRYWITFSDRLLYNVHKMLLLKVPFFHGKLLHFFCYHFPLYFNCKMTNWKKV